MNKLGEVLSGIQKQGIYRTLRSRPEGIDFSSNDYLGLSTCPRLRAHLVRELEAGCPLGATGSRLLNGQTEFHERVESFLARTFHVSSALLFSSGFMANLAVTSVFGLLGAHFFSDALNHASLIDGMKLTKCTRSTFRHNDLTQLEELISQSDAAIKVIVTESVFSMDGDLAPLAELLALADKFNAWLLIDEAHATGVFGTLGLGRLDSAPTQGPQVISVHTGGKALGGQGAFVLSSLPFRELLINQARSFIFNTALSPLSALHIEYALREIMSRPGEGARLLRTSADFRQGLKPHFETLKSESQIVPVVVGSNDDALKLSARLLALGFDVRAIRSPTVAKGSERLRVTIKSFHSREDLRNLTQAFLESQV